MSANIILSHKIELLANNKAKTHFKKAFGCSRLAYNWGLAKWQEYYKQGIKKSHLDLKKEFNQMKKEQFPFVYEVSKYATQQPFINLNKAFKKFFDDLKKGIVSYPKFKKKNNNFGSYYIGGDQVILKCKNPNSTKQYLKVPNLGYVKLRENLRFQGKINSVTISQQGNKYYASFSVKLTQEEYKRTHSIKNSNKKVGIDLGLNSFLSLSNGLQLIAPKPLNKLNRRLLRKQRQLSKKLYPKTKDDVKKGIKDSNNFKKQSLKINKLHKKISNIRNDFLHKSTSLLLRHFSYIALEDLNTKGMMKNHRLARSLSDVSFYEFNRILEYKVLYQNKNIIKANRFFPSSKTCSSCGNIKQDLKLHNRIYKCDVCNMKLDRDYNASINLENLIGKVLPEFTPVDLTAMLEDLKINNLITSKVEAGIQLKFKNYTFPIVSNSNTSLHLILYDNFCHI